MRWVRLLLGATLVLGGVMAATGTAIALLVADCPEECVARGQRALGTALLLGEVMLVLLGAALLRDAARRPYGPARGGGT